METQKLLEAPVLLGKRQETLQEKYKGLVDLFGSEAQLRSEIADWFEKFVENGDPFNEWSNEERALSIYKLSMLLEFFTGNYGRQN